VAGPRRAIAIARTGTAQAREFRDDKHSRADATHRDCGDETCIPVSDVHGVV
jgi:hypothetical protein